MSAPAQTSSMGPPSSSRMCPLKRQRDENGVRIRRDTTQQPHADTVLARTHSSGSYASTVSRTSTTASTSSRSRHSTSQRHSESKSFYDESSGSMPARQRHSASSRSLPESQSQRAKKHETSTRISSGNRFYADIIAKQQKEHAMRRQKAMESPPVVTRITRSASLPAKQSSPITRTPSAATSERVPSTTNIITRTSSLEFAASFFQLALYRTPSSTESVV